MKNHNIYNQYLEYVSLKHAQPHIQDQPARTLNQLTHGQHQNINCWSWWNRMRNSKSIVQIANWSYSHPRHGHYRSTSLLIQLSNLNRQFLFKQVHKGMSKAIVAR